MPIDQLLGSIKKLYFEERELAYLHNESLATEKLCYKQVSKLINNLDAA